MEDQPGKGLGRWMLAGACVLAMVLLTLVFQSLVEEQRNPNRSPLSSAGDLGIEVILERNRQGHYVFTGTINGRPAEFLVDTGASDVVVPLALARSLELPFGREARAMTANGLTTIYATTIASIRIGAIELHDVRASINTGVQPGGILLGMSALKQIDFVQRGDQLTLHQVAE